MTRGLINHLRGNAVAYVALFVALGGTSYAAIRISNHSLTPVKLNSRYFGGYVREWASVAADGHLAKSSDRPVVRQQVDLPGVYQMVWPTRPTSDCVASVGVGVGPDGSVPGYATAEGSRAARQDEQTIVHTYDAVGQPNPLPFAVELVCSIPRQS